MTISLTEGFGTPLRDSTADGILTTTVTGTLAERIRARLGAPADAPVTLREEHLEWGTDWTREFETTFTVRAGEQSVEFIPDGSQTDEWVTGAQRPESIRDTVYARFTAWLRAGDDTQALIAEWFEPHESCDWWESWTVNTTSPLYRAVADRSRGRIERVTLARIPEKVERDWRDRTKLADTDWAAWRLDGIAPADDHGFRAISFRRHFAVGEYNEHVGRVSPLALKEITDAIMPGTGRL